MNISIIIPTYNRCKYIGITIESLINQQYDGGAVEIIIADNNSTDDTKRIVEHFIESHPSKQIKYFLEKRQGVHFARNSAAKLAKYELLYFTDDDMIAAPNLLEELVKVFLFDPQVATATGRVLPVWEKEPPVWIKRYCFNSLLSLLNPPIDFLITSEIDYLYSCHQAIRRDVLFECEGYNPENTKGVWIGDGETGLNIKIKNLGYKFGFNGHSVIQHIIPESRTTQSYLNKRIGNSGFCHSYTRYRLKRPSSFNLLIVMILRSFVKAPFHLAQILFEALKLQDGNYLRFGYAYIFYYYKRAIYDLKLLFNREWRGFVLKDDWLTNDHDINI
jgi:glucosyl-dolichyl phosphate glucuronosyltransferase